MHAVLTCALFLIVPLIAREYRFPIRLVVAPAPFQLFLAIRDVMVAPPLRKSLFGLLVVFLFPYRQRLYW